MSDIFKNIETPIYPQRSSIAQTSNINTPSIQVQSALPATPSKDVVEVSSKKTERKGPVKLLKSFIAGIKKFFASAGAYIKGTVKGAAVGTVAGSVVYTLGAGINSLRQKAAAKAQKQIKNIPNKHLAIGAGVVVLAYNLWNASLNATQQRSEIDLRYKGLKNK